MHRAHALWGRGTGCTEVVSPPSLPKTRFSPSRCAQCMLGSSLAPSNARPQAPPFSGSWALMSSSWSAASLCPEPNELSRPTGAALGVCAGLGPRWHIEAPFTRRPARRAAGGGGAWGTCVRVLRVASVSPLTRRADREPQCPGPPPRPPHRHCARVHWHQALSLGWRKDVRLFTRQPTLPRLAQLTRGCDTEEETDGCRETQEDDNLLFS